MKKLHARRLKSDPLVFIDAEKLMEQVSEGRSEGGEDEDNAAEALEDKETGGQTDDQSTLSNQLEELLRQAEALGLSGPELEKAKQAMAKKGTSGVGEGGWEALGSGGQSFEEGEEHDGVSPALQEFLDSLGDPKMAV
jgi:hypothetical protein